MRRLADALRAVAPALATAVAGPVGPLAVAAVKAVSGVVGAPEGTKVEHLVKALTEDGADIDKLKSANDAFEMRHRVELARLENADRSSARKMRVALGGDATSSIVAFGVLAVFALSVCLAFWLAFVEASMPEGIALMIGGVVGYASAKADAVVSFYFGSSKGEHAARDNGQ